MPSQLHKMTNDRIVFRSAATISLLVSLCACSDGTTITSPTPIVTPQADVSQADASQNSPDTIETAHDAHAQGAIDFTGSNDDIWPPQPTNITNVSKIERPIDDESDPQKKTQFQNQPRRTILSNSSIATLVGKNYAWLGSHEVTAKSSNITQTKMDIFSYDNNTLVVVSVNEETGEVISVDSTPANIYQPAESQEEVKKAIALADAALRKQGFTEHVQLTGTALMAYPSAIETAESGHAFYSERKLYVTFGPGKGVLPHYRATVNLSRSVVETSGAME